MKQLVFIAFLCLLLVGCSTTTTLTNPTSSTIPPSSLSSTTTTTTATEPTTTTTNDPNRIPFSNVAGDVEDIVVTLIYHPEEHFHFVIDEVKMDSVRKQAIVTITIEDADYAKSLYIMKSSAQSKTGNTKTGMLAQKGPVSTYQLILDHIAHPGVYDFSIVKRLYTDSKSTDYKADVSLEIAFPKYFDMKGIGTGYMGYVDRKVNIDIAMTHEEYNTQEASFRISDPARSIQKAKWMIYEEETKTLVQVGEISTTYERSSSGMLEQFFTLQNLVFGFRYQMIIFVSGHNGIREFTDYEIGERSFLLGKDDSMVEYDLDTYAYIKGGSLTEDGLDVRAVLQVLKAKMNPQTQVPYEYALRIRDDSQNILWERIIQPNTDQIIHLTNEFLRFGSTISIEDTDASVVLAKIEMPFQKPTFRFSLFAKADSTEMKITFQRKDATILDGEIRIFLNDEMIQSFAHELWNQNESVTMILPYKSPYDFYYIEIDLTYSGFGGFDQVLESRPLRKLMTNETY